MKWWNRLVVVGLIVLVMCVCGQAMRVTGIDNWCTESGGHLEGYINPECVTP
jgi:hypothetical protein